MTNSLAPESAGELAQEEARQTLEQLTAALVIATAKISYYESLINKMNELSDGPKIPLADEVLKELIDNG